MNKLLFAEDILKNPTSVDGDFLCGFNSRIGGENQWEVVAGYSHGPTRGVRTRGWEYANELFMSGKIFATNNFHHLHCSGGYAFPYGGKWVCNKCGSNKCEKDWWVCKVLEEGKEFFCFGLNFVNLQESENYAFGPTTEDAITNYGIKMSKIL